MPKGKQSQAIGRSRGGCTTKFHALADSEGRLYALLLTPGQTHDINGARALLASTALRDCLIGDTTYAADDLRHFLTAQGCKPVISLKPNRVNKPDFDAKPYKQRNLIERSFRRLKDWRAIATRYNKIARNFLAGLCLVVTLVF